MTVPDAEGQFGVGKILGVDLDGVLAHYNGKYDPNRIGRPRDGAKEWLLSLLDAGFHVIIFTSRGTGDVVEWLLEHDFPLPNNLDTVKIRGENVRTHLYINAYPHRPSKNKGKPPFWLLIDDRATTFRGDFGEFTPERIMDFHPWWSLPPRPKIPEYAVEMNCPNIRCQKPMGLESVRIFQVGEKKDRQYYSCKSCDISVMVRNPEVLK